MQQFQNVSVSYFKTKMSSFKCKVIFRVVCLTFFMCKNRFPYEFTFQTFSPFQNKESVSLSMTHQLSGPLMSRRHIALRASPEPWSKRRISPVWFFFILSFSLHRLKWKIIHNYSLWDEVPTGCTDLVAPYRARDQKTCSPAYSENYLFIPGCNPHRRQQFKILR